MSFLETFIAVFLAVLMAEFAKDIYDEWFRAKAKKIITQSKTEAKGLIDDLTK